MTRTEHLLVCLAEECAEIQHVVAKALRFGLDDIPPGQHIFAELTNAGRLTQEVTDLLGVLELLQESGVPVLSGERKHILMKKEKVEMYMSYARERGTLEAIEIDASGK